MIRFIFFPPSIQWKENNNKTFVKKLSYIYQVNIEVTLKWKLKHIKGDLFEDGKTPLKE